jgi:hypothetical protein
MRDVHLADLQASSNSLFRKITWSSSGTTIITATAKTAGVPFYMSESVVSGAGTYAITQDGSGSSVLSEGPNDWNVDGSGNYTGSNWISITGAATTRPTSDSTSANILKFLPHNSDEDAAGNPKSYSVLYGLGIRSSTGAIVTTRTNPNEVRVPASFRGNIGDPTGGYYLKLDCTTSTAKVVIKNSGSHTWLSGAYDRVAVDRVSQQGQVRLDGGTVAELDILGSGVSGKVKVKDGCTVTNMHMLDCPGADVHVGTGATMTLLEINSGKLKIDRAITTANTYGSARVTHTDGTITDWDNRGAYIWFNGDNQLGTTTGGGLTNYSGTFDFRSNKSVTGVTVYNALIFGGSIVDQGGLATINFFTGNISTGSSATSGITYRGGTVASETAAAVIGNQAT